MGKPCVGFGLSAPSLREDSALTKHVSRLDRKGCSSETVQEQHQTLQSIVESIDLYTCVNSMWKHVCILHIIFLANIYIYIFIEYNCIHADFIRRCSKSNFICICGCMASIKRMNAANRIIRIIPCHGVGGRWKGRRRRREEMAGFCEEFVFCAGHRRSNSFGFKKTPKNPENPDIPFSWGEFETQKSSSCLQVKFAWMS